MDGNDRTAELSRRHQGSRSDPVRGRNDLHRGARLDGRRVVKVENPERRRSGPPGVADPYYFMIVQRQQASITVNLKSERGLALVKEMAKHADVFTENFAPGAVERLGLGYDVDQRASTRASSMPRSRASARAAPTKRACASIRSRRLAAVR